MTAEELPKLYTLFNGCALLHIILGVVLIKQKQRTAHITSMIIALLFSTAFLGCYLYYHFTVGHVKWGGPRNWIMTLYFTLLISHVPLAILNLPMIIMTVIPALRNRFDKHKRMAKWALPIWVYVSITGIIIYLMCYEWFGPPIRG